MPRCTSGALWELRDLAKNVRESGDELEAELSASLRVPGEGVTEVRLCLRSEANRHSRSSRRDRTASQG